MTKIITILIFLFLIFFFGCSYSNKERVINFDKDAYNSNLEIWKGHNIGDYKFDHHVSAVGYSSNYRVYVKNGVVDSADKIDSDGNDLSADHIDISSLRTINELFDYIMEMYNSNKGKIVNISDTYYYRAFTIEYDSTYGFPTKIVFDMYVPEDITDVGSSYHYIKNFKSL